MKRGFFSLHEESKRHLQYHRLAEHEAENQTSTLQSDGNRGDENMIQILIHGFLNKISKRMMIRAVRNQ